MNSERPVPTDGQKFRILLLNAMTRPTAAAVLVVTVVIAITISYWFLPVGLAFYAFLVWSSLHDANESREVLNEVLYPDRARKIEIGKLQGGYRTALQRALETRKKIETAVSETSDPGIRKALASATGDLDELTGTIYDIALKAQSLGGSLQGSNINVSSVQSDIVRLENLVKNTKDEFSLNQYRQTLEGKRQQLQNYQDTTEALNRWHAQLDYALSTLDTIFSQVLRIKSSEVLSLSTATDEVSQSLHEQVEALKATSDALDKVYGYK